MKLGVVTTSYPRDENDHAGNFVHEHVQWLRSQGALVDVVACGTGAGATRVGGRCFGGHGAPEHLRKKPWDAWDAAKATLRLRSEIRARAQHWDGIIAHWLVPSALCAALSADVPITGVAHSADVALIEKLRFGRVLAPLWSKRLSKICLVSPRLRTRFLKSAGPFARQLESRCEITPMGITLADFQCEPESKKSGVLFLGRLVPIKGVDRLLAAAGHMKRDTQVWIAGDGPERARLEAQAIRLPNQSRVTIHFVGSVSPQKRSALFKKAKVVVVPSREIRGRSEGAPLVLREAMAAAAALIISKEVACDDSSIRAVDASSPLAFARALDAALTADTPALAPATLSTFDWSHVGPALLPTPLI